jgi:hypothetical protein
MQSSERTPFHMVSVGVGVGATWAQSYKTFSWFLSFIRLALGPFVTRARRQSKIDSKAFWHIVLTYFFKLHYFTIHYITLQTSKMDKNNQNNHLALLIYVNPWHKFWKVIIEKTFLQIVLTYFFKLHYFTLHYITLKTHLSK